MVRHGAVHVTLSARAGGVDVCVDGLKLASRALTELRLPEGLVDEVDVPAGDPASLRFVKRFVRPDAGA
jgi:hypothetical protein